VSKSSGGCRVAGGRGVPRASTNVGDGIAGAAPTLSRDELAELTGLTIGPKLEFVLAGDRLWHREVDGWHEYPPYPAVPSAGP
jgi:hypothetical protein